MGKMGNISRRQFFRFSVSGAIFGLFAGSGALFAAEPLTYDYLRVILYPKTEKEKAYLQEIAAQIKKRALPERVVYVALRYSEKKQKAQRLCYFAETLPILCKKAGVKLAVRSPNEKKG